MIVKSTTIAKIKRRDDRAQSDNVVAFVVATTRRLQTIHRNRIIRLTGITM